MIELKDIREAVRGLGLSGRPVCLHSSLRSFGPVEKGPLTIVEGFLAEGCTVLVPTFSDAYGIPPPEDLRPERNGWDYDVAHGPTPGSGRVYSPQSVEIDKDMGAVPALVVRTPGRERGNHPLNSFAAVGPLAGELIAGQNGDDVYAPFRELTRRSGWLALLGVGLTRMTFLHWAEQEAGRTLFRRWANGTDGKPTMVAAGSCSYGFEAFEPVLAPFGQRRRVGESLWLVYPARETVAAAVRAIRERPAITHCGDPACERCRDAMKGGPIL